MTDDSISGSTEGEESADGNGRTSAPEETAPGDEETPSQEGDETTGDGESAVGSPGLDRTDLGETTDPEETADPEGTTDSLVEETAEKETAQADQSGENDPTAEEATVAGNPMAGVEPDPENRDDSDVRESPAPPGEATGDAEQPSPTDFVPEDVRKYERFKKMDGARYERVNEFLRDRTYVTAREWAIARLCADFRTETGVEMTKIGENLPRLVPFMEDTYTPQAVNQARHSFEEKVRKSGATFLYGAMSGFFTAEQLDDLMYEITEVAKFLLEVEGVDLSVEEELEAEDRILSVMREVREQSEQLRHEGVECPECGHEIGAEGDD